MSKGAASNLLFQSSDWNFETLARTYDAIEEIALEDLGLDVYPNQLEIISSEQMLDAYSSVGMPLMYQHWSFGSASFSRIISIAGAGAASPMSW